MNKKILIYDNENIIDKECVDILTENNYSVLIENDLDAFIQKSVTDENIDLTMIDIADNNKGIEVANSILQKRHLPIIFLVSSLDSDISEMLQSIENYGVITKQCESNIILFTVQLAFNLFNRKKEIENNFGKLFHKLHKIDVHKNDIRDVSLVNLVDVTGLKFLIDAVFKITNIGMAVLDENGKVLISKNWQRICSDFHRVHPQTRQFCLESDLELTADIEPGKYKMYKCKNNLWDVATPIKLGKYFLGNIFVGQFFLDDEEIDYDLFRKQARKYGFDEKEYMQALEEVPRYSRKSIENAMLFYSHLASFIAKESHSNLRLLKLLHEQSEAKLKLTDEHAMISGVFRSVPISIIAWSKDNKLIKTNEIFKKLTGYEDEEIATLEKWYEKVYPDEEYRNKVKNVYKQDSQNEYARRELVITCKDGSKKEVEFKGTFLQDGRKIITIIDKTEDNRLKKIEKRKEALVEITAEVTRILLEEIDLQHALQRVVTNIGKKNEHDRVYIFKANIDKDNNCQISQLCEWSRQSIPAQIDNPKLQNLNFSENAPISYPKLKKGEVVNSLIKDMHPIERDFLAKQGIISIMIVPIMVKSEFWGFIGFDSCSENYNWIKNDQSSLQTIASSISSAITRKQAEESLRKSEERNQALLNAIPDMMFIFDEFGNFVDVNANNLKEMYAEPSEIVGKNISDILPDYLTKITIQNINYVKRTGQSIEYNYHLKIDGEIHYYETRMVACGINSYLAIVKNVTELKKKEIEKQKLQAKLKQSQKLEAIGTLAGGIAHDFNNMLSVIIGNSELALLSAEKYTPLTNNLMEIKKAGEKSAELTRQLLAFARKQAIKPKLINLNSTIESMLKMLKRLIGESIIIEWEPHQGDTSLFIDPSQIDQILANLCVNARDAIEGIGKITISSKIFEVDKKQQFLTPEMKLGKYIMLEVSDTGKGFSQEILPKIFDPFFTTKEEGKGTGLGLSTVYGIVKQNDGYIYADSRVNEGTSFKIYLPKYEEYEKVEEDKFEDFYMDQSHETILLVEDEPAILRMITTLLVNQGYNVLFAHSPMDALKIVDKFSKNIDLLITDIIMPEMNGKELSDKIKLMKPNIEILFISGYTDNVIKIHGVLEEKVNLLHKPFKRKELLRAVKKILNP